MASSESLVASARRTLGPYRRTHWVHDDREAVEWLAHESSPLGLVVESDLGPTRGIEVLSRLRERIPFVPAVLLATAPDRDELERGYRFRASHVQLPLDDDSLVPFVFRALTQEVVADERVGCLVESLVLGRVLTPREAELLVLVIGDVPRKTILARMAITENTLKGYVRQVLRKLEAGDLDKLAARVLRVALQNGGRAA